MAAKSSEDDPKLVQLLQVLREIREQADIDGTKKKNGETTGRFCYFHTMKTP